MLLNNRTVTNTWVFTEQDMPGYEKTNQVKADPSMPPIPARLLYDRDRRNNNKGGGFANRGGGSWNKGQRKEPYIRKAIPSTKVPFCIKKDLC